MAPRGRKRKPPLLHIVKGTYRKDRHGPAPETEEPLPERESLWPAPKYLKKREAALYRELMKVAWWLGDADSYKAAMWCKLEIEHRNATTKSPMIAGRLAQLRALGSELGLDPAARARLGVISGRKPKTAGSEEKPKPKDKYFKD